MTLKPRPANDCSRRILIVSRCEDGDSPLPAPCSPGRASGAPRSDTSMASDRRPSRAYSEPRPGCSQGSTARSKNKVNSINFSRSFLRHCRYGAKCARRHERADVPAIAAVRPVAARGAAELVESIHAESVGRFVGGPTLLIPGIGAKSALGQVAGRVAAGAIAGGLQPTTEHTAASSSPRAIAGAGTAGVLRWCSARRDDAAQYRWCQSPRSVRGSCCIGAPIAHAIHSGCDTTLV